jgi:hypothetical protein
MKREIKRYNEREWARYSLTSEGLRGFLNQLAIIDANRAQVNGCETT